MGSRCNLCAATIYGGKAFYNSRLQPSGYMDLIDYDLGRQLLGVTLKWGTSNNNGNLPSATAKLSICCRAGFGGRVADLAFGVLAPNAVAFFLRFPLIAPVGSVATLGATMLSLLCFEAHLAISVLAVADARHFDVIAEITENHAMLLRAEDLNGNWLRDGAEVGLDLIGKGNTLSHWACCSPQQAGS